MNNMEGVGLSQYAAGGGILAEEAGLLNKSSARSRESPPSAAVQRPPPKPSPHYVSVSYSSIKQHSGQDYRHTDRSAFQAWGGERSKSEVRTTLLLLLSSIPSSCLLVFC